MPIQAFIDDSGGKRQSPVFVFAGLIGTASVWADFSNVWRRTLHTSPRIESFRMSDAATLNGQFRRWKPEQRDRKLLRLANVIRAYGVKRGLTAIHCTTHMDAFEKFIAANAGKPLNDPYFFPFHIMILSVCYELLERGQKRQFEIFFDEQVIAGPRAKQWYPIIRELAEPDARAILPVEPIFRSDSTFLPLQAADMLAWSFRRSSSGHNPFEWLGHILGVIPMSQFSSSMTEERWKGIFEQSYTPSVMQRAAKMYDEMFGA